MSELKTCEVIALRRMDGAGNLKAFADIRIGGGLVVRGCPVMNGKNGLFASLPRRVDSVGVWRDVVVPVDDELRKIYTSAILSSYAQEEEAPVGER